jgi:hypothetical protein
MHRHLTWSLKFHLESVVVMVSAMHTLPAVRATVIVDSVALQFAVAEVTVYVHLLQLCIGHALQGAV